MNVKRILQILPIMLLLCASAHGQCSGGGTHTLPVGWTPASLQTCLTQINADGTTIILPAGTTIFSGASLPVNVTFTNSVVIQGAGAISATTSGASTTGTDQTILINHMGNSQPMMLLAGVAGKTLRFTGIAVLDDGGTPGPAAGGGMIAFYGREKSLRVDHCHLNILLNGSKGFYFAGEVNGVADHDYITTNQAITNDLVFQNGSAWNGSPGPYGNASWADGDHFGSSQFMFVEDSRIDTGYIGDCAEGGRFVFRHSTVVNNNGMAEHGTHDQFRGCRASESYLNTFTNAVTTSGGTMHNNSGTALVWGNNVTGYQAAIDLQYYRINGVPFTSPAPPAGFGMCGTSLGPSTWDQNSVANGYACLDLPGRGQGDLLTDFISSFSDVLNSTTGTRVWPHQVLSPIYAWNNTMAAGISFVVKDSVGITADNKDWFQQFGSPGEPGTFNGISGVGTGTIDPNLGGAYTNAPNCSSVNGYPGPGYWNSVSQHLWVCTALNTWTDFYTPFTYPHPLVGPTTGPVLVFSPSPAAFANQNVGTTSSPLTVTVSNTGTASQVMATPYFTITGANASNFSNTGTGTCANGATVAVSASCTVNLTFTPSATGARTAALNIQGTVFSSNALNGTGTGPTLSLSPSPVAFGNQGVGTTSGGLTVTVSNTGTGAQTLSTPFFTVTGTNPADFARSGGTCANAGTIAASSSCTIILTFTPAASGARSANLNILGTVNGLAGITGTGTQPALTITPSPGAFGNQNVNTTSGPLTITVTNSGTASEILSTPYFTLTGANAADFTNAGTGSCANGGTITASSSCTVNLTFTPSASGSRAATLTIQGTVNGTNSLTGTGIAPFAALAPLSIAFSNQTTNVPSSNHAVTLSNTGTATLTIASITISGANAAEFSTNGSTCGASLAASTSCSLNVVFTPTTVGSKTASLVFVTNAASSPDSVALTGTGVAPAVPVLSFSPGLGAFGNQLVNTTSAPLTMTVSNVGTATEVLGTPFFTFSGPNAAEFARTGGTCANAGTIAVSASCTITFTFTPTGTGGRAAALNILGTANGSAALSGTGTLPIIGLSPSPGAFGNQLQGTTSGPLTITVSNTGTAAEVLATPFFTITGTNLTNFANAGTGTCVNGGSIATSASCTIILTFTPSATGARTATLNIQGTVNASDSLTGTGTLPVIGLAPSPAAFGNQSVSSTSAPLTVTISNTGTATQTLSTPFFTITGTNAADFARSGGTCANAGTIAASGSCTILLTFTPALAGARSATLNIAGTVNATGALTGTGVAAILSIAPSPGAFGNQNVNTTSSPLTVTVSNVGTATETLNTPYFTLTGTNAANFANAGTGTCSNGGTIAAAASCTVNLTFTPSASGARAATLTISGTVNGTDSLTGTGIAPGVLLSPTSIVFGNQTINTSSGNHAVTLTNNGTSTLNISSIALTGANSTEFSTNGSTCGASLAAAASCSLNVVFTPTTAVSKTANLTFTTDASTSPDNVSLTGTGIVPAVPVLGFSPTPGTFGNQLQNTTSAGITFTVSNSGTATETLNTPFFTVTGANSGDFARSGGTCVNAGSVAVSGSCTIILTFTPTSTGSRTATLNVLGTVNASNALSGTGTLPVLALSPSPVAFGNQQQASSSFPIVVTISNTGTAAQALATPYFTITGANASSFANSGLGSCVNGASIAASTSCTAFIVFTPSTTGALTATLNILGTVNGSDSLTGTGTSLAPPAVTLLPVSIAFGNQDDGTSSSPTSVSMTNTGTGVMNITSILVTGANATEFSINTNTCGPTLAVAASCTWNVVFSPATAGSKTAAVTVTTNATSSPDALPLTGTGRVPTPPSTPAPAITIVSILPPGSVLISNSSSGISPRNVLASAQGCSQDGIAYTNPCKFLISCGNCRQSTTVRFNGTKVAQSYSNGVITAFVPISLIAMPNISTDYAFSLSN